MGSPARSRGVTLIELVVTIVVVAAAVAAVLAVLSAAAARSADGMVRQQAVQIGESYLHEILEKPFGVTAACFPNCTRTQMAAVGDYNGLVNAGVRDATDTAVPALSGYTVSVTANYTGLGAITAASQQAQLVTVNVTAPTGAKVVLSGYRTLYP
jgi:MSHA pilin protein MshD